MASGDRPHELDIPLGNRRRADRDSQEPGCRRQRQSREAGAGITRHGGSGTVSARVRSGHRHSRRRDAADNERARRTRNQVPADVNGYITAIRFYKGAQNTGAHVGNLWTGTGTLLATVTFASESASGWQEVAAADPRRDHREYDLRRVVSHEHGLLRRRRRLLRDTAVDNGPLHALRDGQDWGRTASTGTGAAAFPNQTFNSTNYWVDVVFVTSVAAGHHAAASRSVTPRPARRALRSHTTVTATFSENVDPATVRRRHSSCATAANRSSRHGHLHRGRRAQQRCSRQRARASPRPIRRPCAAAPGVKDSAGNPLASDSSGRSPRAPPPPPPNEGPGGPMLVVARAGIRSRGYYAEILRTEGLNACSLRWTSAR